MLLARDIEHEEFLQRYILGVTFTMGTWDDETHIKILQRAADLARDAGALEVLDTALFSLSMTETILGNLDAASAYASEGREIRAALGVSADLTEIYRHPELKAWKGESPHTRDTFQGIAQAGEHLGCGAMVSIAHIGLMILNVGQGRYAEACDLAVDLVAHDDLGVHSRILPDLVEAAVRSGKPEVAREALATLEARAEASGTPRALGVLARSQALLADGDEAGALFEAAILKLGNTRGRTDLARAHLLYGEWLRRAKRRTAARTQLQSALEIFEDIGAADFAERTRSELAVTGGTARKRSVDTWSDLTPQEEQVARLASQGNTNKEIGARLFISARTVDYHLRKVYQKLGIGSRRDLRGIFS
jgi:DNA-binding CsgD family transcriptional regulator